MLVHLATVGSEEKETAGGAAEDGEEAAEEAQEGLVVVVARKSVPALVRGADVCPSVEQAAQVRATERFGATAGSTEGANSRSTSECGWSSTICCETES